MNHESLDARSDNRAGGTLRRLILALALSAGCVAEAPREIGAEHHAGDAADPATEVHTGTIATAAGPMEIRYELLDGHAVLEGDILIPASDFLDKDTAHAATVVRAQRWPGGIVPYVIDPALPDPARVTSAIAHWQQYTAIRFVARTTETDYVRFVDGSGCSSYVGRVGGAQSLYLNASCSTGSAIHEIGHAVGLWHEHARWDRNSHVTIHTQNIAPGYAQSFDPYTLGIDAGAYDVGSIMHLSSYAFSANGQPTITKRDGSLITGQRNGLSYIDRLGVSILYATPATGDRMRPGEMLAPGEAITSSNGVFRFGYALDGNLMLYRVSTSQLLWKSNTQGQPPGGCFMQPDGNLVLFRADGLPIWHSNTAGRTGSTLYVQIDGNAVIYFGGVPVWATNTAGG